MLSFNPIYLYVYKKRVYFLSNVKITTPPPSPTSPWKKLPPLSQQLPSKIKVLSSSPLLKIWLDVQPPPLPPQEKGRRVHTMESMWQLLSLVASCHNSGGIGGKAKVLVLTKVMSKGDDRIIVQSSH